MRVLLADDQNDIRLLTQEYLENSGYRVLAVASGEEALRALRRESFDIILLDEEMPGMTGTQVLQTLRSEKKLSRDLVVIALTGYNTETDKKRLHKAGFVAVLGKPFRFDVLEAILGDFAAGKTSRSAVDSVSANAPDEPNSLLARVGGDEQLLRRMARAFLNDLPPRIAAMGNAISEKQGETLASLAHALKGSVAILGAERAAVLCRELQQFAQDDNFAEAARTFVHLKEAIAELEANLRGYAGQKAAAPEAQPPVKTKRCLPDSKRK
jgi:two-component system sensor histidine kinase/response regulator